MNSCVLPADIVTLAERVVSENIAAERTITLAESCTGGLVSAALTEIPGSSAILDRSFITYSNAAKMDALNVASDIIETFGAVSIACAWAMAQGALAQSQADLAVAVSGIAGPEGGSDLKPVGTVVFARAVRGETCEQEGDLKRFDSQDRSEIRHQATLCALELLLP